MTRIGFSVLGAAGFAAIMAMGMLTTAAEAATRKLCNSGAKNTTLTCCTIMKRKAFFRQQHEELNCAKEIKCTGKKSGKYCYVTVTLRDEGGDYTPDGGDTPDSGTPTTSISLARG